MQRYGKTATLPNLDGIILRPNGKVIPLHSMIEDEIKRRIEQQLGFTPTREQGAAIEVFASFLTSRQSRSAMILSGSAGTGKTTLASAMVNALNSMKSEFVLMAPTGRAAKVFSLHSGHPTFTIHRTIYRQKVVGARLSGFSLTINKHSDTLFIVDEASMVANKGYSDTSFGSGLLLDDLVQFVYEGTRCRLMLIGDKAQLPPVGEEESPALIPEVMEKYGLKIFHSHLNEVLRQGEGSGILLNATSIRNLITHDSVTLLPRVRFKGFADIVSLSGEMLVEQISQSYSKVGIDETMIVTRSNKRANVYNNGIRAMVLGKEEELCPGDLLMAVKNNYYWTEKHKMELSFIANGDRLRLRKVANIRQLYGFRFADITAELPDYDSMELKATVILQSLQSESPSLSAEQSDSLYKGILEDYSHISSKNQLYKAMREDQYYNALQIKYAYAVTCHKAQGGQWAHVYVDQGFMTDSMLTPDYIHWLYTAFTRATDVLYLVNWPKTQTDDSP